MSWSVETIEILNKIRLNSIFLSKYYKKRHIFYNDKLKYFKIPLIIFNSISSVASVGLGTYGFSQNLISALVCGIGLTNSIIGSIELYLGINEKASGSILLSKEYYILSVDIFKTIHLTSSERMTDPLTFLNECYSRYIDLIKKNGLVDKDIQDKLIDLDGFVKTPNIPSTPLSINVSNTSSDSFDAV
jgi:hypothetical protein